VIKIANDAGIQLKENTWLGEKIIYLDEVDSSSEYIKRNLDEMTEGTVVVARRQLQGKGRAGRVWESPVGGLWFSILLRPDIPLDRTALLSLVFAVAISRGLNRFVWESCWIKWPNDIYIYNKKLAGILLEIDRKGNNTWLIAGAGINVNIDKKELSPHTQSMAASLAEHAECAIDVNEVLSVVLSYMQSYYLHFLSYGFEDILEEFKAKCQHLQKSVEIHLPDRVVSGINVDIDRQGKLLIDTGREIENISAGDVRVL